MSRQVHRASQYASGTGHLEIDHSCFHIWWSLGIMMKKSNNKGLKMDHYSVLLVISPNKVLNKQ